MRCASTTSARLRVLAPNDGVGFKDISDQLGHANIGITVNRYAHRDRNDAHDRIRRAMAARHVLASEAGGSVVPLRRPSTS